jgi:hypothetical protein
MVESLKIVVLAKTDAEIALNQQSYRTALMAPFMELLSVGPEDFTIHWPGNLGVETVDDAVVLQLGQTLSTTKASGARLRGSVLASVVSAAGVRRFQLGSPAEEYEYRQILKDPSQIRFVRYDSDGPSAEASYAFTLETPSIAGATQDLGLSLPKSQPFTDELLRWIVSHHHYESKLDLALSDSTGHIVEAISGVINEDIEAVRSLPGIYVDEEKDGNQM